MDLKVVKGLMDAGSTLLKNGINFEFHVFNNYGLERERNHAARDFLRTKNDYLLFVDSDVILEYGTILKLLRDNKDIISALYRQYPNVPVALTHNDPTETWKWVFMKEEELIQRAREGIIQVDGVGSGCILIKHKVFKSIRAPWYKFSSKYGDMYGEDLYFCDKATAKGFKIFIDLNVPCKHLKNIEF